LSRVGRGAARGRSNLRGGPHVSPEKARPLLDSWNRDADYFRRAAQAARHGVPQWAGVLAAARAAELELDDTLNEIEEAVTMLPVANPGYRMLLWAQITAISLSQSISKSLGVLETADCTKGVSSSGQPLEKAVPSSKEQEEGGIYQLFSPSVRGVVEPIVATLPAV
jgi:hypothetical protein